MEAEDPLSQLRDIHLPEPVTFWPPAPGWWVLLVLILIGLGFLYRHAIAAMIQRRKLASTLKELDEAYEAYTELEAFEHKQNQAGLDYLASVNILLNRVALVFYPDTPAGQLTGTAWLSFLDQHGDTSDFSTGPGTLLADGIYRRTFDTNNTDAEALHALAKHWIEHTYLLHQHKNKSSGLNLFARKRGATS